MRTTIDLDDKLFRKAKAEAAMRGIAFRDLVENGVRLALEAKASRKEQKKRTKLPRFGVKKLGKLNIPDDIAFRSQQQEDYARYAASS